MQKIKGYLCRLFSDTLADWRLYFLTLLVFVSSACLIWLEYSVARLFLTLALAMILSLSLGFVINLIDNDKYRRTVFVIAVAIINLMFIVDLFLTIKFYKVFDDDIYFLINNTNSNEAGDFASTFVNLKVVLQILAIITCVNLAVYWLSKFIVKGAKRSKWITLGTYIVCILGVSVSVVLLLTGRTHVKIAECNNLSRFIHPYVFRNNGVYETKMIYQQCLALEGRISKNLQDSTVYVVVIGESHNKFHSSLFGYELPTEPNLTRRYDNGEIVKFDNCISAQAVTWKVMKSVYSFAKIFDGIEQCPIFPAVFHQAGYHVSLYDNQFLADCSNLLVNDPDISALCYDYRNEKIYDYDGDLVASIKVPDAPALVIVNLNGQHFFYYDRPSSDFDRPFTVDMYAQYEPERQQLLCDYDNATCYVDTQIENIISKFEDKNTCLIYFSDHGQNLGENGLVGHGFGVSLNKSSRVNIPFFVWGSESFRHTDMWQKIAGASDLPICTDDFSHTLVDIAGIGYEGVDRSRSFVSDSYDVSRQADYAVNLTGNEYYEK